MEDEHMQLIAEQGQKEMEAQPAIEDVTAPKIKKWDHIAVRPETFSEFRRIRSSNYTSDDAFIKYLLANVKPRDLKYEAEYDKMVIATQDKLNNENKETTASN